MYATGKPALRIPAPGMAFNMILDFRAENPFVNPSIVQNPVPIDKRLASPYKILYWSHTSYSFTLC